MPKKPKLIEVKRDVWISQKYEKTLKRLKKELRELSKQKEVKEKDGRQISK